MKIWKYSRQGKEAAEKINKKVNNGGITDEEKKEIMKTILFSYKIAVDAFIENASDNTKLELWGKVNVK